jgi:hypothetical protein
MRNQNTISIAKMLNVSVVWVRFLARTGAIPATKKGRSWYFSGEEVLKAYCNDNSYKGD